MTAVQESVRDRAAWVCVMHAADAFPDLPLIRCICGEPNLTVTEFAKHQADALAAAGLLVWEPARREATP